MMASSGGYYSSSSIERVRSSTDIAAVIGRYVQLKRSGSSIKGLCPFHKEKTPSFFVSTERQMYHCFGCGTGGDVFSFMMNYLGFTFSEAVEELASEAGIELERSSRSSSRTDSFRNILSEAHEFYSRLLHSPEGSSVQRYLESRDLSPDTVRELGIGFAPGGSRLTRMLREKGYSESQLVESGLAVRSSRDGSVYDRFRQRVLFPICDRRGRPISFGGRLLKKADAPKYLNGPDSPIYRKGDYLYGFRDAARSARDLDMVILVEGYFDHARFFQAGFHCTVATCGTALTANQARQIGSMASTVHICYDGDKAGQRAAVRAAEVMLQQGFMPRIAALPEGQDPDDHLKNRPESAVLELMESSSDPIRFALGLLGGWKAVKGSGRKVKVVRRLAEIAHSASDPIVRETLMKTITQETGYSAGTLELQLEQLDRGRGPKKRQKGEKLDRWDSRILAAILLSPEAGARDLLQFIREDDLRSEAAVRIFREIEEQLSEGVSIFQPSALSPEDAALCTSILTLSPEPDEESDLDRLKRAVGRQRLLGERDSLRKELAAAVGEEQQMELRRKIMAIEKRLSGMQAQLTGGT